MIVVNGEEIKPKKEFTKLIEQFANEFYDTLKRQQVLVDNEQIVYEDVPSKIQKTLKELFDMEDIDENNIIVIKMVVDPWVKWESPFYSWYKGFYFYESYLNFRISKYYKLNRVPLTEEVVRVHEGLILQLKDSIFKGFSHVKFYEGSL